MRFRSYSTGLDALSGESERGGARSLVRALALIAGGVAGWVMLATFAPAAQAGTAVRSCNVFVCDDLIFRGDPGERNDLRSSIELKQHGYEYWLADRENPIRLGEPEEAFSGNGCERPARGQSTPFFGVARDHIVVCRWGRSEAQYVMLLGDRGDSASLAGSGFVYGEQGDDGVTAAGFLDGGADDDYLTGRSDRDRLRGGAGRDTLDGNFGPDDLRGGDGYDTVEYFAGSGNRGALHVTIGDGNTNDGGRCDRFDLTAGGCTGSDFGRGDEVFGDVERLVGLVGNDVFIGDGSNEELIGRGGNDRLRGSGGNDTLWGGGRFPSADGVAIFGGLNDLAGGDGDDTLIGGYDGDLLAGNDGNDHLVGDQRGPEGSDALSGGAGNDYLDGGDEALMPGGGPSLDTLVGGAGVDVADYSARSAGLDISLDDIANDGEAGEHDDVASSVETVVGGSGSDSIDGSPSENILRGRAGDDVLDGGAGADQLIGNEGFDTAVYGSRTNGVLVTLDDSFNDGETFVVDSSEVSEGDNVTTTIERVIGGIGADEFHAGTKAAVEFYGNDGGDTLYGSPHADVLSGEGGDDTMHAIDGVVDHVMGGSGTDTAFVDKDLDIVEEVENLP